MRSSEVLSYLPPPHTPGFDLASPRVFQVLVALIHHAVRFGAAPEPSLLDPPKADSPAADPTEKPLALSAGKKAKNPRQTNPRSLSKQPTVGSKAQTPVLQAGFTVGQLARACGCNRNTAGAALKELVILGWITKSRERHSGGEFGGFRYRLCVPPTVLTKAAAHLYTSRLEQTEDRLDQLRQRIQESANQDGKRGHVAPGSTKPEDSEPISMPEVRKELQSHR